MIEVSFMQCRTSKATQLKEKIKEISKEMSITAYTEITVQDLV